MNGEEVGRSPRGPVLKQRNGVEKQEGRGGPKGYTFHNSYQG